VKFAFVQAQKAEFPVEMMCRHFDVSRSGYYAFCQRSPSLRAAQDRALAEKIQAIHTRSRGTYGRPPTWHAAHGPSTSVPGPVVAQK
jgi:putative transposase